MPMLFILSGPHVGRSFTIDGPAVLGRGKDCAVRLADRSVSREHARIEPVDGGWVVVDLGSRNGVKMHGERVERAALEDMTEVTLGEVVLRFRLEAGAEASAQPLSTAAAAPPRPPAQTPQRPAPPKVDEEEDAGFDLEEDIALEAPAQAQESKKPAPRAGIEPEVTARDLERARILSETRSSGFLSGDMSQWPALMRWGAYLGVAAIMVALFYGAYKLVEILRAG